MKIRKASWIYLTLRRNCFLKDVFEGKMERKGTAGRRHKQVLCDLTETRQYWTLKEENVLWERLWTYRKKRPFRYLWRYSPPRA